MEDLNGGLKMEHSDPDKISLNPCATTMMPSVVDATVMNVNPSRVSSNTVTKVHLSTNSDPSYPSLTLSNHLCDVDSSDGCLEGKIIDSITEEERTGLKPESPVLMEPTSSSVSHHSTRSKGKKVAHLPVGRHVFEDSFKICEPPIDHAKAEITEVGSIPVLLSSAMERDRSRVHEAFDQRVGFTDDIDIKAEATDEDHLFGSNSHQEDVNPSKSKVRGQKKKQSCSVSTRRKRKQKETDNSTASSIGNLEMADGYANSKNGYLCQACNLTFHSDLLLEAHVQSRHKDGQEQGQVRTKRKYVKKHHVVKVKQYFPCDECGKTFQWHSHLLKHQTIHSPEKPFQCSECLKFFSRVDHLQGHMRRHAGEKPYECEHCGKRFFDRVSLAGHSRTHTGEKPFLCGVCNKGFNDLRYLKRHMRTHTGENPYECDECDESFIDCRSLTRHKLKHTGEKPYRCEECGRSFLDGCSLIRHRKTHSMDKPYQCTNCDKCFNDIHNLKRHQRTHTGVKPFTCEDCDMSFWCKSDMTKHQRTHTVGWPSKFKCEECGKGFSRKTQLTTHMEKHAMEDDS